MALIQQAPPQLIEQINLAYKAIKDIHTIAVNAGNAIQEEELFDSCIMIAENASTDINDIVDTEVLINPYYSVRFMEHDMISEKIHKKLNRDTTLFGNRIRALLVVVLDTRDKPKMDAAFRKLIDGVMKMEDTWRIIHDYAKPVPQEAPPKERTRGGRKHRTHRKRTHRKRSQRKHTYCRRTHRK